MDTAEIVFKYFPGLSDQQMAQFKALGGLYAEWNTKVNVISRKDIDNLYANHVLHSLAIAKFLGPVAADSTMLDMGTGGGFPGVPLAIFYPECQFHMIDRIGKKIKVAADICDAIGLTNVSFQHGDIGECRQRYNYVVSRAVMPFDQLVPLIKKNIMLPAKGTAGLNIVPNGLVCLKGGDLAAETAPYAEGVEIYPIKDFIPEAHFEDKYIVYLSF